MAKFHQNSLHKIVFVCKFVSILVMNAVKESLKSFKINFVVKENKWILFYRILLPIAQSFIII